MRVLFLLIALGAAAASSGQEVRVPKHGKTIPNSYLVVLKRPATGRRVAVGVRSAAADLAARHGGRLKRVFEHAVPGFSVEMSAAAARRLARSPQVAFVEQNAIVKLHWTDSWGIDRIDQRDLPLDGFYNAPWGGAGVHVYVIDSGIRTTHSQFGGRAIHEVSFVDGSGADDDCLGHGTHVAGTIGGSSVGVAPGVRLHSVRVFGCATSTSTESIVAAVDWVTGYSIPPAVANMSLGSPASDTLDFAVESSLASGVTYVVSAGNDDAANACDGSPGRVPGVLTVAASDAGDGRASFSNVGGCVDLFAPGADILSAAHWDDLSMQSMSGTSMAAPHVAGAAARLLQQASLWPDQVHAELVQDATPDRLYDVWDAPNLLLFTGASQAPTATPTPTPTPTPRTPTPTPTPAVPTPTPTPYVGVLKGGTSCPAGATEIAIKMDNEDDRQASSLSGWVGAVTKESAGNIWYRFCKIEASRLAGAPGEFAVLQLSSTCPAGTLRFSRIFDNENSATGNRVLPDGANIAPNVVGLGTGGDSKLYFCRYSGGTGRFPYLGGVRYGVFASSAALPAPHADAWGTVYSDDEDSSNHNTYVDWQHGSYGTWSRTALYPRLISGEANTSLYVARVVGQPTVPVALCRATPSQGVYWLETMLQDAGSYARHGRNIREYRWSFDDGGEDAFGPGPFYRGYPAPEWPSPGRTYYPQLTVTDDAGETATTTCPVSVYRCEEAANGDPCPE